ncbi:MAG: precorrin-6A reductase [Selenomonadaceae bacterium]|nr:precorrin-6A reductase [Selenomonadaceae bacterium]
MDEASRVFVFAGTADGRQLVAALLERGFAVTASVVSRYGGELLENAETAGHDLVINEQPLDEAQLAAYCQAHAIGAIVDASHPYAVNVSQNAMAVAKALGLPYVRYERDLTEMHYDKLTVVHSYEEAAETAARLGKTVFLTTGSRNLRKFAEAPALQGKTIIARVLPTPDVIAECIDLGIPPGQIVALQGPFSQALNRELFLRYQADVIITKNSGQVGGTDTKLAAAQELALPVIVIDRPKLAYPVIARTFEEVFANLTSSVAPLSEGGGPRSGRGCVEGRS